MAGGLVSALVAALVMLTGGNAAATFPGVNGKIAFVRNGDVYTMNLDGSGEANLTNDPSTDDEPRWSADGASIVFTSNRTGQYQIYTVNANGTGLMQVASSSGDDVWPAWSPDGRKIAFARYMPSGTYEIWVTNADGTGQTQLTADPVDNIQPSWSPDGTKIAFSKNTGSTGGYDIYTMDADGTVQRNLTNNPARDTLPDWSPDGKDIAFTRYDGSGSAYQVLVTTDGTTQSQVTTSGTDYQARWSPDGKKMVFVSFQDGNPEIYMMNADGTLQTRITNNLVGDSLPDWQPLVANTGASGPGQPTASDGPVTIKTDVLVHMVDHYHVSIGVCPYGSYDCKVPAPGALVVRVYDPTAPDFLGTFDSSHPKRFDQVFNQNAGLVGYCDAPGGTGGCAAGLQETGKYLVIVRYIDVYSTGQTQIYLVREVSRGDFKDTDGGGTRDLATKKFHFDEEITKGATVRFGGDAKVVFP